LPDLLKLGGIQLKQSDLISQHMARPSVAAGVMSARSSVPGVKGRQCLAVASQAAEPILATALRLSLPRTALHLKATSRTAERTHPVPGKREVTAIFSLAET
jgi:hypothetical protein